MKSEEDSTKDSVTESMDPKELRTQIELQLSEVDMLQVSVTSLNVPKAKLLWPCKFTYAEIHMVQVLLC